MAILRVVANTILVSSKGHGSSGAAIEKNTAKKSRTKTTPKRFSILVRSRSLRLPPRCGGRCLSLTARTYTSARARYTLVAIDQCQRDFL